jgi:hypothetical protein
MSSRVNYVVCSAEGEMVAYDRIGAYTVYHQLDCGPAETLRTVARDQVPGGGAAWSDVMADAGVLIDVDAKRLTFFGNNLLGEIAVNRAYLRRLAGRWAGWDVNWAYQGVSDLWPETAADDESRFPSRRRDWALNDRDWADTADPWDGIEGDPVTNGHLDVDLVSVRTADATTHWLYERSWPHPAWAGPDLLDRLPPGTPGPVHYRGIPAKGLHIDVPGRWVGVWTAMWLSGTWDALAAAWPGWTLRAWNDRYEEHVVALGGTVVLPAYDEEAALVALGPRIENPYGTR